MNRRAAAAAAALGLAFAAASAWGAKSAFVYDTEGKVNFTRDRRTFEIQNDQPIKSGDLLRTSDDGLIDLNLYSWCGVRVMENSDVTVVKALENDLHLKLERGTMLASVKQRSGSSRVTLETPTVLVVVQDTEYLRAKQCVMAVDARLKDGVNHSTFALKRGEAILTFKESGNSLRVQEEQAVDMADGRFVTPARAATKEELDLADQARGIFLE